MARLPWFRPSRHFTTSPEHPHEETPLKAVQFNVTVPGYLLAKSLGRVTDSAVYGGLSGVGMVQKDLPPLPGPKWVRVDVMLGGICGSDLGNISFKSSPAMEPFGSFPAVLGHEILGRVVEVGPEVDPGLIGQRVVVDPMIHCDVRGHAPEAWVPVLSGRPTRHLRDGR